jgi:hypothetical protein
LVSRFRKQRSTDIRLRFYLRSSSGHLSDGGEQPDYEKSGACDFQLARRKTGIKSSETRKISGIREKLLAGSASYAAMPAAAQALTGRVDIIPVLR